jgi:acetyltransferase-like isoleucine patch superfamily enzyme
MRKPGAMAKDSPSMTPKPWGVRRRAFLYVRGLFIRAQMAIYRRFLGMDIGENVRISLRARLDFTHPSGVHIGDNTYVAFDAIIFTHDMCRAMHVDTYVGKNCFIGAQAIIMPGVRVGDHCIVGSGAVVTTDVPEGSIVAGNPAKVIRSGIKTVQWGILETAYARALAESQKREAEARQASSA